MFGGGNQVSVACGQEDFSDLNDLPVNDLGNLLDQTFPLTAPRLTDPFVTLWTMILSSGLCPSFAYVADFYAITKV